MLFFLTFYSIKESRKKKKLSSTTVFNTDNIEVFLRQKISIDFWRIVWLWRLE